MSDTTRTDRADADHSDFLKSLEGLGGGEDSLELYAPGELPADSGARWGEAATSHHGEFVFPGRRVLLLRDRTWAARPELCLDRTRRGEWVLDDTVLVCRGCGLDTT